MGPSGSGPGRPRRAERWGRKAPARGRPGLDETWRPRGYGPPAPRARGAPLGAVKAAAAVEEEREDVGAASASRGGRGPFGGRASRPARRGGRGRGRRRARDRVGAARRGPPAPPLALRTGNCRGLRAAAAGCVGVVTPIFIAAGLIGARGAGRRGGCGVWANVLGAGLGPSTKSPLPRLQSECGRLRPVDPDPIFL